MHSLRIILLTLCLTLSTVSHADFKRDYGRALKDIQNGDHQRAIDLLNQAILDNAQSAERVRIYGMRFEPYLPHYYLGTAYQAIGDCTAAVAAFDESLRLGVIQNTDQVQILNQNRDQCLSEVVDYSALAAEARQARSGLNTILDEIDAFSRQSDAQRVLGGNSNWGSTVSNARRADSEFDQLLAYAEQQNDADGIRNLTSQTQTLTSSLEQILQNSRSQLAALQQQDQENMAERLAAERRQIIQTVASIRALPDNGVTDPQINSLRTELDNLVGQADRLNESSSLNEVQRLNRSLSGSLRSYRSSLQEYNARQQAIARKTPPGELKRLADTYFSGDYAGVARQAQPESFDDSRHRIQALLFRAAAQYNLSQLDESGVSQQIERARADIRQIKQIDAGFTPYIAAFSPKFVDLFESTR